MKFYSFTANYAKIALRNAKSKNPFFAAQFGKLSASLCGHIATFAVKNL